ncbi:hypothetical protein ASG63_08885 [Methylobacterium sp. Leaf94]|uniref:hypothetical protein n=1 Tax=Methylobacterium sp. Leaf94 TaxID=1736250 RepID=UPI0006FCDE49|nr:hypothetical protein [Methylobacterium sp. Leaf94]KQU17611.1 hypothetical protein ASG63_08885 [Methylobacterium sp. Leaf94]
MTEWLDAIINLPADALKAIGTIAVGGTLAGATYVVSRIKEARRPADTVPGLPRFAFDPVDRDMGFSLIRTGTDLTRALHDHGEILRRSFRPDDGDGNPPPAPAPIHRRTRTRS